MTIFIATYTIEAKSKGPLAFSKKTDLSSYIKMSATVIEKLMVMIVLISEKTNNQLRISLNWGTL